MEPFETYEHADHIVKLYYDVYGYVVETKTGEHVDSCWGFLGALEYVKGQANEAAEHAQSTEEQERSEEIATLDNNIARLQQEDRDSKESI